VRPADVLAGPLTVQSGRSGMGELLTGPAPPSAVICFNYELTVGALIAINELGITVPDELSFVGFDSVELAQVTKPRLAMITQPTPHIASQAAELIHTRLTAQAGPRVHAVVTRAGELVPGGSVGPPPGWRPRNGTTREVTG